MLNPIVVITNSIENTFKTANPPLLSFFLPAIAISKRKMNRKIVDAPKANIIIKVPSLKNII